VAHSTLPALPRSITWGGPKTLAQVPEAARRHNDKLAADSQTQNEIACLEAAKAETNGRVRCGLAFIRGRLKRAQEIKQEREAKRGI
jgi:hypothetical protein